MAKNYFGKLIGYIRSLIYNATIGYFYTQTVLRKVLEDIPDNSRILDVGIGTGYTYAKNSNYIKKKNLQIVGVDIDHEYIRSAIHTIKSSGLDSYIKFINQDIYTIPHEHLAVESFDFVIFSDSYAVIPNVHAMITFCEKYLVNNGDMIVTSTLFDKYNSFISWFKRRIFYFSSIEFGDMMLKDNLKRYILTRCTEVNDICFKLIDEKKVPIINYSFKTYAVKWRPTTKSL